jgi:hypothetical protein
MKQGKIYLSQFICHCVDNQNLLISSRSVPALEGKALCMSVPVVRVVFLKQISQFEISSKGKK